MPLRDKRVERENKLLLKELPYYGYKDLASAHQQFNIVCSHPLCPEINLTNLRAYLTLTSLIWMYLHINRSKSAAVLIANLDVTTFLLIISSGKNIG